MLRRIAIFLAAVVIALVGTPASAERRALVIGLSAYEGLPPLSNPSKDIELISAKLSSAGFRVTQISSENGTRTRLDQAITSFVETINEGDEVVVFYAGHGIQIDGNNFIAPIDAPSPSSPSTRLLTTKLYPMEALVETVNDRLPRIHMWFIDACRTNPYSIVRGAEAGLGQFESGIPNSLVVFSARRNQVALDRLRSDPPDQVLGSPFVRAFVELFDIYKNSNVSDYAKKVRVRLRQLAQPSDQYPEIVDYTDDQWCFDACAERQAVVAVAAAKGPVLKNANLSVLSTAVSRLPGPVSSAVSLSDQSLRPALFVGKKSGIGCKETFSDAHPLGCDLLKQVSQRFDNQASPFKSYSVTTTVQVPVNVRSSLPVPDTTGTKYGRVVATLPAGAKAKLVGFAALQYAGDTFYWGLLDVAPGAVDR